MPPSPLQACVRESTMTTSTPACLNKLKACIYRCTVNGASKSICKNSPMSTFPIVESAYNNDRLCSVSMTPIFSHCSCSDKSECIFSIIPLAINNALTVFPLPLAPVIMIGTFIFSRLAFFISILKPPI